MPPFTTSGTVFYNPTITTTSTASTTLPGTIYTTIGPTSISFTSDIEEKTKEYCDKVDQHVDKLEEDIEFLNEKRKLNEVHIEHLINQNLQKDTKIKELEDTVTFLKGYTEHLEILIHTLEEKIK